MLRVGEQFVARGGRLLPETITVVNEDTNENATSYLHHLQPAKQSRSEKTRNVSMPLGESLNLTTSIKLFSATRPKPPTTRFYSVDEESAQRITTFELFSSEQDVIQLALHELLIQVEDDQCDRFYVLDEAHESCAVVCGKQTAFWYATTPAVRARLKRMGVEYTFTSANKEFERMETMLETGMTGRYAQECTLYFSTAMQVRGMVEAMGNLKHRVRVVASNPFPNCTVKLCAVKTTVRFATERDAEQWTTVMEGAYFNSLEVDRFLQAFYKQNGASGVRVKMQTLGLTADFDRACSELYKDEAEEE